MNVFNQIKIISNLAYMLLTSLCWCCAYAEIWQPDLGDGKYQNPIIYADYSDPDVIRVGEDYYMVSSSFNVMPGIPVLHSRDLVHWRIISHVYQNLPYEKFDKPVHGQGSWAPAIRHHKGLFYVYFCTPHDGLYMATAKRPEGPWNLHTMAEVELWEDPAPFWDEDGQAYLVRSKVRADNLYLHKMSADGKTLLDDGVLIYRDLQNQPVIEGPKMLKKDGWYYILSPAGGVQTGWQTVLRARNIYGPYEAKTVLHQGNTDINGPHQGGLVETQNGEWWFIHFQDKGIYGRVAHLQPVTWKSGWPEMGVDINKDGVGEPVSTWTKPNLPTDVHNSIPQTSDDFSGKKLGLQWQWHANPKTQWYSFSKGQLRLNMASNPSQNGNLYFVPNLLLQKIPAPQFSATTSIKFHTGSIKDKSGLLVMGKTWGYLALYSDADGIHLGMFKGQYEQYDDATQMLTSIALKSHTPDTSYYLRVTLHESGQYQFSYSLDGKTFLTIGPQLTATAGVWIGAKVGLFALNPSLKPSKGYAEFDWFTVE